MDKEPAGIGECDDCGDVTGLWAVSPEDEGAWAVCGACLRT